MPARQQARARYLIPGSVSEHAGKEGVHVPSIHGLAVLLDALSISKNQALPQQRIALPELICDLPMQKGMQSKRNPLQSGPELAPEPEPEQGQEGPGQTKEER